MREFKDMNGREWMATVREEGGTDYKGRFYLVLQLMEDIEAEPLELREVRWNSERTAGRTLRAMSVVELRRRLRSATGRAT